MPIDISEVTALTREATRSLQRQPAEMRRIGASAATEERQTHDYRNRTGNLQRSTLATPLQVGTNEASCDLVAGADYASFVNRRGLMRIDDLAAQASQEIEFYFDGEAERLGSL